MSTFQKYSVFTSDIYKMRTQYLLKYFQKQSVLSTYSSTFS